MNVNERVVTGAAWLDERKPGWADQIDVDALNMRTSTTCILGQLSPEHVRGVWWSVKIYWDFQMFAVEELHDLGFTNVRPYCGSWNDLRDAWIVAIHERRMVRV